VLGPAEEENVSQESPFDDWVQELNNDPERTAKGALIVYLVNRGVSMTRVEDLAEEALQEGLARAVAKSRESYDAFFHFRNFAIRAAQHFLIDRYRRLRRERRLPEGYDPAANLPMSVVPVQECLNLLPDDLRQLFGLLYEEGHTLEEAADLLLAPDGRSPNARRLVIWRRHRALLDRMRVLLLESEYAPDEAPGALQLAPTGVPHLPSTGRREPTGRGPQPGRWG
jgi:DNA-directed RNA polymerase specialized sigma24 family protein